MTGIDDALTADHERLDRILGDLAAALVARPAAAAALEAFERGLVPHMAWEEDLLFPALLAAGYPAQRVEGLVIDHQRIRASLAELRTALAQGDAPGAAAAAEDVRIYLVGHNGDEEKILYPDADRLLPPAERSRLLDRWAARSATS